MRKQKRQMCVRRMLLFFLACVLICAAPPSAAQAAIMQTAKNSTVQKKKTSTKTVTIETSGEITKKKVKSGGSVILPVEVNKRGYTFLGWSTVPGQTCNPMYQAYQKIQVTKNIHLYPVKYKWNQEPDIYAGGLADSVEKYDKIIFVGDSRTAMLRSTLKQQCSSDSLKKVGFVCKTGEGLDWMKKYGEKELLNEISGMDDNALTDGKNFFVKIGTKMIPGLVTKINYSVDVNTGEKRSAYTLKKNEIASCTLEFSEKIVVDEFDRHRTLGELILIDRVTNMTSACGVVRKTFVSQDRSQIGKVDEQVRAGLKGQTPVVVEFPIGKEGITLDFAEQVEKGLTVLGRHTYLYHPAASENYAETVRHLKAAGLIVLLVLDENTAKDETLKTLDGFYANWQIDGITVKDAIDFVKKKSAFTVQSVHDGNYI